MHQSLSVRNKLPLLPRPRGGSRERAFGYPRAECACVLFSCTTTGLDQPAGSDHARVSRATHSMQGSFRGLGTTGQWASPVRAVVSGKLGGMAALSSPKLPSVVGRREPGWLWKGQHREDICVVGGGPKSEERGARSSDLSPYLISDDVYAEVCLVVLRCCY